MKKDLKCPYCELIKSEYICDTCGKKLEIIPITLIFGYGSSLDGATYDFCDNECLLQFILGEMKKQNPRINIIFGKEK